VYRRAIIDSPNRSRLAGTLKLALVALLIVVSRFAPAQDSIDEDSDPGRFEIRSAAVERHGAVYYLDAWMELRLSSEARDALRSGVPLTIRLDVELEHHRRFWTDAADAVLRQRYQLEYHALTERYVVSNLNSGDQTSFGTLYSALNSLGRIDMLPLIDAALVRPGKRRYARLRVVLDSDRFPGPLRLLAFWRRDWSIESDWYRCPLADD
jgi:hypothetical protein